MKVNSTSKFIPNFFTSQPDDLDDFEPQSLPQPFRPIQNVLEKSLCKTNRKSKIPKAFLDDQSQQEPQNPLPLPSKIQATVAPQCQERQQINSGFLNARKQSKMILSADIEESSQQSQEEKKCEEIVSLPAVRDIDKLRKCWNGSSEDDEKQSSKIDGTKLDKAKQKETMQLSNESIFQTIKNGTMRCLLRRDKQSSSGFIQYNLYLQGSLQHVLTVRKQGVWLYCIYLRQRSTTSDYFTYTQIAKLESNFIGNKYTLIRDKEKYSIATICYETNILGLSGPRKFFVYLPKVPLPFEYLSDCYENGKHRDKIEKCVSKTAKWNDKVQSYVLNFNGRATESSIKNFVVTDTEEREESNFIIFGKVGPDVYNLDIQSPFNLLQGVAVALTAFERKLTCD